MSKPKAPEPEKNSVAGFARTAHQEAINTLAKYPAKAVNGGPDAYAWAEYAVDRIIAAVREASSGVIPTFCGNQYAHEAHSWVPGRGTGYQTYRECAGWESSNG